MNQPQTESSLEALGKFWTPANILSLLRLVLGIPIAVLVYMRGPGDYLVLGLVFLAIFSDWLDGKLARITKTVSEWGKVLDPIADKVAGLLVILALTARGDTVFTWWFVGFIVIRDVLIVSGATIISRQRRKVSMSAWSGKIAVGVLALTVFAVLLQADPPIPLYLMWASAVLYAYSFLRYFGRYLQFRQAHSDQSEDEAGNTVDSSGTTASEAAG